MYGRGNYGFYQGTAGGIPGGCRRAGEKLSGGQKQRIAFARALLKQSDYLFMDEATAAMDIRGKDQVWKSVKRHMEGKTVLMVAHDRQTVQKADYIIVMHNGKIICQENRRKYMPRIHITEN